MHRRARLLIAPTGSAANWEQIAGAMTESIEALAATEAEYTGLLRGVERAARMDMALAEALESQISQLVEADLDTAQPKINAETVRLSLSAQFIGRRLFSNQAASLLLANMIPV